MNETFPLVLANVSEMAFTSFRGINSTLDHMNQTMDNVTYSDSSSIWFPTRIVYPSLPTNSAEWYNETLRLWNEGDVNITCNHFFVIVDKIPPDIEFIRWLIYVILFPVVAVIGTIGNFINLLVLRRFKHRTYVYLYWLAVSDLLTMFLDFVVPWRVLKAPANENWAYFFCNVTPATTGWLVATSSYMVLVITVERFYAVCFPMQSRTGTAGMNPTLVSFVCLVLGFITLYPSRHILMTQTVGLQAEGDFLPACYVCKYVKVDGFLAVYYRIRGTLTRTLPTIIVAFLNTCTIIGLRRHQHNRSSTLNQQPGPQEQAEDRIKLIIMSITTIFVLCYAPTCIKDVFAPPNGESSLWYETFRLGALLLLHVNTACNFYVYCMCSPAIRYELRKVLRTEFFRGSRWSLRSQTTNFTSSTSNGGSITEGTKTRSFNNSLFTWKTTESARYTLGRYTKDFSVTVRTWQVSVKPKTANGWRMVELEEKVLALKRAMKKAILDLATSHPRLLEAAELLLSAYLRGYQEPKDQWTPRMWFAIEQSNLTAIELRRRLEKRQLTFFDIREDVSNLVSLYVYIRKEEKSAYIVLRTRIQQLILILANLANQLENRTHVHQTNWTAVLDLFEETDSSIDESTSDENRWAQEVLDRLEAQHVIGVGGFGTCWKALFADAFPLTVKIIGRSRKGDRPDRPDRPSRAYSEKAFASITRCRYLSRFFACIPVEGFYLSIQEYIRGIDVQKLVRDQTMLPTNICRIIMAQLGLVLQYLQLKGFIHRDIKPSNIMLMPDCRIKLIDYDLVKLCTGKYDRGPVRSYIRKTFAEFCDKELSGTLMYIAPEIIQHRPYGRASDWWSMGVTLHCMSTGRPPFRHRDKDKLCDLILKRQLTSAPGDSEDPGQHALSRSLMCRDLYKRITVARFNEYVDHPYFQTIKWETINNRDQPLEDYEPLMSMLEKNGDGRWSPRREVLVIPEEKKKEKLPTGEPVHSYLSNVMRDMLDRVDWMNHSLSEADLSDPVDEFYEKVQRPELTMASYRFEKFLQDSS